MAKGTSLSALEGFFQIWKLRLKQHQWSGEGKNNIGKGSLLQIFLL
jgi:hypothetical protein